MTRKWKYQANGLRITINYPTGELIIEVHPGQFI